MYVCYCKNINQKSILTAIREGYRTLASLGERTGAGTNCGQCRPELRRLIAEAEGQQEKRPPGPPARPLTAPMKGDPKVIAYLNDALKNELTVINQYFLHSRMLRNWGMTRLAEKEKSESIDEMKHADRLIERTLFLEGLPNLQDIGRLRIGENVEEILQCDLDMEMHAIPLLREAVLYCESCRDFVSRELFESILEGEEDHVDYLETQLGLIQKMGLPNYIQMQTGTD